jgi:hypothetical protein
VSMTVQLLFILLCVMYLTPCFQLLNVLESVEVNADNSVIQDSLMFLIKRSSAPDHETPQVTHQSLARPNRHFCQFVIEYVSMALYFDCWYPFLSNQAPAPYRKVSSTISSVWIILFQFMSLQFVLSWIIPCHRPFRTKLWRGLHTIVPSYLIFVWTSTLQLLWGYSEPMAT